MLKKDILIEPTASIKDTLKKLSQTAEKTLFVKDERQRLLGAITDGDIRHYILSGKSLDRDISKLYNRKPVYIRKKDFSVDLAKKLLLKNKIEVLPILDEEDRIADFITWNYIFSGDKISIFPKGKVDIPVVIMAGGKGVRLEPFTKILPKPLIPIGDKSIIEMIIDEFRGWGINEYHLILSHKGAMIEAYFDSIEKDYKISFIKEKNFLGTAGGLRALNGNIKSSFIVSNCDVIVKANFEEVINFHKEEKALLTVLSSIQHHRIPYGVVKSKEKGRIREIIEKPEYTFTVNTGVYIFEKEALKYIPEGIPSDMPDLIKCLIKNDKKVIMYPVNESDYVDIGQWEGYKKTIEKLESLT